MTITWQGQSCFKIVGKDVTIVTDPFDPKYTGLKNIRPKADIVTVSHDHEDHNNTKLLSEYYLLINTPGEFEMKGAMVKGIVSFHDNQKGKKLGINIIYVIEVDGIRIAHLGDLGEDLNEKQLDEIGDVDILLVPVGGKYTIDGKRAAEITNKIEPGIVIPMHYKIPGLKIDLESADKFAKEMGADTKKTENRLSVKLKDIPQEDTETVILKPE